MARRRQTKQTKNPEVKEEVEIKEDKGVNRNQFLDSLAKVKPGVSDKAIIEQSTHFIFDPDRIWSYNDEISVSHKFETGVTGAVVADKIFKLCGKIEDETIEIIQGESGIIIKGKNFETTLSVDAEIKLKKIEAPGINSKKWKKLPADFMEGVKLAFFSASTNMVKPELTCLLISGKEIYSTDSYRGTKYKMEEEFDGTFIIPAKIAVKLQNYNPTKMMEENNWLHFINKEGTVFSCRTYDAEYPEKALKKVFKTEGHQIILPEAFSHVVDRASVLISEDFALDRTITISLAGDKIICSGKGIDGKYKETTKIDYDGEEIEVKVQPEFLNQILGKLEVVTIGESQLLFQGENFEHFMRLSG